MLWLDGDTRILTSYDQELTCSRSQLPQGIRYEYNAPSRHLVSHLDVRARATDDGRLRVNRRRLPGGGGNSLPFRSWQNNTDDRVPSRAATARDPCDTVLPLLSPCAQHPPVAAREGRTDERHVEYSATFERHLSTSRADSERFYPEPFVAALVTGG